MISRKKKETAVLDMACVGQLRETKRRRLLGAKDKVRSRYDKDLTKKKRGMERERETQTWPRIPEHRRDRQHYQRRKQSVKVPGAPLHAWQ